MHISLQVFELFAVVFGLLNFIFFKLNLLRMIELYNSVIFFLITIYFSLNKVLRKLLQIKDEMKYKCLISKYFVNYKFFSFLFK